MRKNNKFNDIVELEQRREMIQKMKLLLRHVPTHGRRSSLHRPVQRWLLHHVFLSDNKTFAIAWHCSALRAIAPFGGDAEGRGGVFPRPLGRFYGFLNDYGIPLAFRKPYNLASLVEMHPLWCLRHHLSPGGGTGPMDLSLPDKAII